MADDDLGFDDDYSEDEVEVMIVPREDALERVGVSAEAFEEALADAIDKYHELIEGLADDDDAPPVEDMPVKIGDRSFRLGDLAEVQISDESE